MLVRVRELGGVAVVAVVVMNAVVVLVVSVVEGRVNWTRLVKR